MASHNILLSFRQVPIQDDKTMQKYIDLTFPK